MSISIGVIKKDPKEVHILDLHRDKKATYIKKESRRHENTLDQRMDPPDQAREPPSQLELYSLEHSYIGLELEGGYHSLVFGSVKSLLGNSS
jgi:hypothetical protein